MSAGGELVNFQHVATLRKLGWRAVVLLDDSSQVAMPSRPFSVPMLQHGAALKFAPHDVVVMPEVILPPAWQNTAQQCRVVMHNQNPFYTFRSFDSMQALNAFGLFGALCCSHFTREMLHRWGSTTDWHVVRPFVLPVFAQAGQLPGVQRKRQIAFMPRKRPAEAQLLKSMFISMYPQLADVPWVEISNMARPQVAQVLAESLVFASLSHHEGLGLPPLEAMAAGCLVAGFTGQGGAEYATTENGRWVAEGDLEGLVHALAADVQADVSTIDVRRAAGQATAAGFDMAQFEAGLNTAWLNVLGNEASLYRLPEGAHGLEATDVA
jgi:hypothetical protein